MTLEKDRPIACSALAGMESGEGLKTVKLLGWGEVQSTKGTFRVDEEAAAAIIKAFEDHGAALPVDLEHETIDETLPPKNRLGAVGWIERIFAERNRGVFALIRWNSAGKTRITEDSHRYLSPVLLIRKSDRRAIEISSAAITNKPALVDAERLAASVTHSDTNNVDIETVSLAKGTAMELVTKLRDSMGMDQGASVEEVLGEALKRIQPAPSGDTTVAASAREADGASTELIELRQRLTSRDADDLVREALSQNKIAARNKEWQTWLHDRATRDIADARDILSHMMPFAAPGSIVRDNAPSRENVERSNVIRTALSNFRADEKTKKMTSETAYLNLALRDANLVAISADEVRQFQISV